MSFPDRLRMVIKQSGLKRDQFACKSKKSRNQIFKYLNGESLPAVDFFQAVKAEFPWVNIEWFVTGIGHMYSSPLGNAFSQTKYNDKKIQETDGKSSEGGDKFSQSQLLWTENKFVNIQEILTILEEYVAPRIIKEIEGKLKKNHVSD